MKSSNECRSNLFAAGADVPAASRARAAISQVCRLIRRGRLRGPVCQWCIRDLVLLPGAQDGADPHSARAGGSRGCEDRPVRQGDRGPARLDRAAALVGEHARATPLRRAAPPAPGARHHRAVAARFDRQGAAQGLAARHGRRRQRARPVERPEIRRHGGEEGLLRAGLLPARIRALHDARRRWHEARCRRQRRRGQPQAHLGRDLADQGRPARARLCGRLARPAHRPPDISLVLRNTDLSGLPQVQAASNATEGDELQEARDTQGRKVLTAHARVAPLRWFVFVELPVEEAYAPLYESIKRSGVLLFGALFLAALAGMFLARRMVVPIQALREGAERIGRGELNQRIVVKTGDEIEALADQFNDMAGKLQESYAGLERKVDERTRELTESLQQQTATAEVLKVISRSTFDLKTVLDTLVASAARLCGAEKGVIFQRDGEVYRLAANYGFSPEAEAYAKDNPLRPGRGSTMGRVALEGRTVHIPDVLADPEYAASGYQTAFGYRTNLGVPLLREGTPIGVFVLTREVVNPFSDKQIELVTTFADQAVIAIENARLFEEVQARTAELTESLEYQTATSDVLNVISRSPSEIQPVLDAIVQTTSVLCGAEDAVILLREGATLRIAAHHGPIPLDFNAKPIERSWVAGRSVADRAAIHVPDLAAAGDEFPLGRSIAEKFGHRTTLAIPLLREDEAVGCLLLRRLVVQPFSDKQIALVETFADQAVIAIENARLFEEVQARTRELSEALEQQTATSEVLQVINASPGNLAPVFE